MPVGSGRQGYGKQDCMSDVASAAISACTCGGAGNAITTALFASAVYF